MRTPPPPDAPALRALLVSSAGGGLVLFIGGLAYADAPDLDTETKLG